MFHKLLLTAAVIAASTVTVSAETVRWARAGLYYPIVSTKLEGTC